MGLNYERVIQIGEHYFTRPEPPKDKREILFMDKSKEDAWWQRSTEYKNLWYDYIPYWTRLYDENTAYSDDDGSLISLNKVDSEYILRIYEQEMQRRRYGVFFRNGNDLEYITGHHYFVLQWMKLAGVDEDYGLFMKYQRDHFYLKEVVWGSPDILGLYTSKPKKTGITAVEMGYYLNKSTMTKGRQMGVMSVSQPQASSVNMMIYFHGFDGLPNPFKPRIKQRADDGGYIIFGDKPFHGRGKAAIKSLAGSERDSALNTRVFAAATKGRGFDSPTMHDIAFDELPKYDTEGKQDPEEVFNNNQETVKIQTRFNGRIWAYSYPPEQDTDGYAKCKTIYFNSKLKTRDILGRTKTGMICYHISSLYSHRDAIDKYGDCDPKRAFYLNDIARKAVKDDPKAYQAKVRQYAIDEKEAWAVGGKGSVFNNIRLAELMVALEDERSINPLEDHLKGKLEWENKLWEAGKKNKRPQGQLGKVEFVPQTAEEMEAGQQSRLRIYQTLPAQMTNLALTHGKDDFGNWLPPARYTFIGGIDPTDYAAAEAVLQGSKNASFTMNLPDEIIDAKARKVVSKIVFSEYLYRPGNPNEAYEDFVKEIIYYDKLVIVEANKPWVYTKLIEDGLGYHMIVRDAETKALRLWDPETPGLPVSMQASATKNDTLETMVRLIYDYFDYVEEGEKDYGAQMKCERLMEQMTRFKANDTTAFDLVLAFGWLLIALETYMVLLLQPDDDMYGMNDMSQALWAIRNSSGIG
jgi:hypothetical protein